MLLSLLIFICAASGQTMAPNNAPISCSDAEASVWSITNIRHSGAAAATLDLEQIVRVHRKVSTAGGTVSGAGFVGMRLCTGDVVETWHGVDVLIFDGVNAIVLGGGSLLAITEPQVLMDGVASLLVEDPEQFSDFQVGQGQNAIELGSYSSTVHVEATRNDDGTTAVNVAVLKENDGEHSVAVRRLGRKNTWKIVKGGEAYYFSGGTGRLLAGTAALPLLRKAAAAQVLLQIDLSTVQISRLYQYVDVRMAPTLQVGSVEMKESVAPTNVTPAPTMAPITPAPTTPLRESPTVERRPSGGITPIQPTSDPGSASPRVPAGDLERFAMPTPFPEDLPQSAPQSLLDGTDDAVAQAWRLLESWPFLLASEESFATRALRDTVLAACFDQHPTTDLWKREIIAEYAGHLGSAQPTAATLDSLAWEIIIQHDNWRQWVEDVVLCTEENAPVD